MLGLAIAAGIDAESAVSLANAAAGLEVDRTGVAPLTRDEIRAELQIHQLNSRRKISDVEQIARWCEEYRRRGKRVVLTNGCFDLLHVGHASYLEEAASLGDVMIVAINSDESVRRLKGPQRPVIGQHERAALLAALGCVDHVVIFDEDTPHVLLRQLRPDILVKGGTYRPHEVVGREVVEAYGGRVSVVGMVQGVSTSQIVQSVLQRGPLRQAG
jgi:D-beta-D-heptose 7-phosphate kinase/D-beta-D-heptose 1-phosphate adenosyltransferase